MFKEGVLKVCDEYVGRRKGGEINGIHGGGTRT